MKTARHFLALVIVALGASMAIVSCVGILAGCAQSAAKPAVDVAAYTAEQMACVEREPSDACHADKAACRLRIDACRAQVKAKYSDGGAP